MRRRPQPHIAAKWRWSGLSVRTRRGLQRVARWWRASIGRLRRLAEHVAVAPCAGQAAVFFTRALAAAVQRVFNGESPRDLGRWWFSWSSQPAELPWSCQPTAGSQAPRYLKGRLRSRRVRWGGRAPVKNLRAHVARRVDASGSLGS
jgi:hypothetical protein